MESRAPRFDRDPISSSLVLEGRGSKRLVRACLFPCLFRASTFSVHCSRAGRSEHPFELACNYPRNSRGEKRRRSENVAELDDNCATVVTRATLSSIKFSVSLLLFPFPFCSFRRRAAGWGQPLLSPRRGEGNNLTQTPFAHPIIIKRERNPWCR